MQKNISYPENSIQLNIKYYLTETDVPTDIVIEDEIDGKQVIAIGGGGNVISNTEITNVTFPSSLRFIGSSVFENCTKLIGTDGNDRFQIPSKVEYIGDYAFYGCTSIKDVIIPQNVTYIGYEAFGGCSKTLKIYGIPGSEAERYANENNIKFVSLDDSANVDDISRLFTYNVLDDDERSVELTGIQPTYINDNKQIVYTKYGESEETILSDLKIPSKLYDDVNGEEHAYKVKKIKSNAFRELNITSLSIGSGVETIGVAAFENCANLVNVDLPTSVKTIGTRAFKGCTELSEIRLPDPIRTIGSYAFDGDSKLSYISQSSTFKKKNDNENNDEETAVVNNKESVLPFRLASIGDGAFRGTNLYGEITIPSNVTYIGKEAFSKCNNITAFTVKSEKVKKLGNKICAESKQLKIVTLSSSVQTIGESAFYKCTNLQNVMGTNGLVNIEAQGFACTGLSGISLPRTLNKVEDLAFRNCPNLTKIVFMNSATDIEGDIFVNSGSGNKILVMSTDVSTAKRYVYDYPNIGSTSGITIPDDENKNEKPTLEFLGLNEKDDFVLGVDTFSFENKSSNFDTSKINMGGLRQIRFGFNRIICKI